MDIVADEVVKRYLEDRDKIEQWLKNVMSFFEIDNRLRLNDGLRTGRPVWHTLKSRLKDAEHLRRKVQRKHMSASMEKCNPQDVANGIYHKMTDLAGVRVLLLSQSHFTQIHKAIMSMVDDADWVLGEPARAMTWDPDAKIEFEQLGLQTEHRDSLYTSVHYLVRPPSGKWCVEVQVRTLFEEIWGELDHQINYPEQTSDDVLRDQLRVLARFVATGSRLVESVVRQQARSSLAGENHSHKAS
jgi:putative GTP pyrophosphokinase